MKTEIEGGLLKLWPSKITINWVCILFSYLVVIFRVGCDFNGDLFLTNFIRGQMLLVAYLVIPNFARC